MKIIKKLTVAFITILLLVTNVSASELDVELSVVQSKENSIEFYTDELYTKKDNSKLPVKVIKQSGEQVTTVYEGLLGGYANGEYNNVDFSKIEFLMVIDISKSEALHIVPVKNENKGNEVQSIQNTQNVTTSLNIQGHFYINNAEIVNNLQNQGVSGNDTLKAQYSVTNNGTTAQPIQLILCLYNLQNGLIDIAYISENVGVNETKTISKEITINADISNCYAKVLLWNSLSGMTPLHEAVQIGNSNAEFEVETATIGCNSDKEYNLVITSQNLPANDNDEFTISYDPTKIELIDLCSLTYPKEMTNGVINGTNIEIVSVNTQDGEIVFKNPNLSTNEVAKVLNSIKFKGLVSDTQTIVTIE